MKKSVKLLLAAVLMVGVVGGVTPAASAYDGEITVEDPLRNCTHYYGWNVDTADPEGSRVYTKNDCSN